MARKIGKWKVRPEGQRQRRFKTFEGAATHAARMFAMDTDVKIIEDGGWSCIRLERGIVPYFMEVNGRYSHEQRETLQYLYKEIVGGDE